MNEFSNCKRLKTGDHLYVNLKSANDQKILIVSLSMNQIIWFSLPDEYQEINKHQLLFDNLEIKNVIQNIIKPDQCIKVSIEFKRELKNEYLDEHSEILKFGGYLLKKIEDDTNQNNKIDNQIEKKSTGETKIKDIEIKPNDIEIKPNDNEIQSNDVIYSRDLNYSPMGNRFNDLPDELFPFIFNHLNFFDLLRSRLVCRRWLYLIDELIRWDELILEYDVLIPRKYDRKWFSIKRTINRNRKIKVTSKLEQLMIENLLLFFKHFNNVKHIIIYNKFRDGFFSHNLFLLKFVKLEQLDYYQSPIYYRKDSTIILHPNLKILNIKDCITMLLLITPQLNSLHLDTYNCIPKIKFIYPLSIVNLTIRCYSIFFSKIRVFGQLKNLIKLEIHLSMSDTFSIFPLFSRLKILPVYPKLEKFILRSIEKDPIHESGFWNEKQVSEHFLTEWHAQNGIKYLFYFLLKNKKEMNHQVQIQIEDLVVNDIEQLIELYQD